MSDSSLHMSSGGCGLVGVVTRECRRAWGSSSRYSMASLAWKRRESVLTAARAVWKQKEGRREERRTGGRRRKFLAFLPS